VIHTRSDLSTGTASN